MIARLFAALGLALLVAVAAPGAASAAPARAVQAGDPTRQVLILLRMQPQHFRPNADYGGGYGDGQGLRARQRIADRLAKDYGLVRVDNWPMPMLGLDCFIMTVPAGASPIEIAGRLSRDPSVEWSEPIGVFHVQGGPATHNDPLFRVQPTAVQWRLAELHQIATGRNVKVAVIDSRIDRAHPDLAGQIDYAEDFAPGHPDGPEQHGTGVAGVIAAVADNDMGIAGVAPRSRLMGLRACWQTGAGPSLTTVCDTLSLAKALDFAISRNAQVINLSLSGPPAPLLGKLIDVATARGTVVVAAFDPTMARGGFPASHPGVVAVADESQADLPAGIYDAPGRDIPTTQPGGRWFLVNGSSYAAAQVSGLFALMRERGPLKRASLVLVGGTGGAIDACATLMRSPVPCACVCTRAAK